jgi:hypothetical protein
MKPSTACDLCNYVSFVTDSNKDLMLWGGGDRNAEREHLKELIIFHNSGP